MAEYCIIGHGMLANALKKRIGIFDWYPTKDTEYLLYFGGVKHTDFESNPEWFASKEAAEFTTLLKYCAQNKIKLIYPSSALVYEKNTTFAQNKKIMEGMAEKFCPNSLGLRIFPVYGLDSHTVINEWCKSISRNVSPIVWGDGTQTRDFIYIDDFVDQVIDSVDNVGVQDIGSGKPHSFNEIIEIINKVLGKEVKPKYITAPPDYSKGISCTKALPTKISLEEGIRKICEKN